MPHPRYASEAPAFFAGASSLCGGGAFCPYIPLAAIAAVPQGTLPLRFAPRVPPLLDFFEISLPLRHGARRRPGRYATS